MRHWLVYTLVRLGVFALVLALLLQVRLESLSTGVHWVLSALLAMAASFCIGYIFLGRQKRDIAGDLERATRRGADELAEDEQLDAAEDAALTSTEPDLTATGPGDAAAPEPVASERDRRREP